MANQRNITSSSPITYAGTKPTNPVAGQLVYDPSSDRMKIYDGIRWQDLVASVDDEFRLEYSTGTVMGRHYYTISPINAQGLWPDMMQWMVETFGPTPDIWDDHDARWYANNAKFWFKDKKDHDWFTLRWTS